MRLSSIDIGSNAIRQLIVQVAEDGSWQVLKKHRETIRLGTDVFNEGFIHYKTMLRLLYAFRRMAKNNKKLKVDHSLAFATSAFRDAKNRKLVIAGIYKTSKIKIKIISGKKEAELIRKAVQKALGLNRESCLLIDIGGGSVELTHLDGTKIAYSKSFKWGMVRTLSMAEKLGKSPTRLIQENLKKNQKKLPRGNFSVAIGTGGNMDAMAKLKLTILRTGPNTQITQNELQKMLFVFKATKPELRSLKFQLRPDRLDVIEPAMILTLSLMKKYKIGRLKIPGTGLKEGAILSLL